MQDLIIGSIPLFVAIVASLLFYKQLEPHWLRLFPFFLFLVFSLQLAGYYYSKTFKRSNHFIFNTVTLVEFLFYFCLFYNTLEIKKYRRVITSALLLFLLSVIGTLFIWGSFWVYNTVLIIIGDILIFCCCLLYFFTLLDADEHRNNFSFPMFWVSTGIMFGNAGIVVYLSLFHLIIKHKLDPNGDVYGVIATASSILEYSLFTIAFLCKSLWKEARS